MKVLIIEDDSDLLRNAEEGLSVENEVFGSYNWFSALGTLHEHEPDIIVLDLSLPCDGMTLEEIELFSPFIGIWFLKKIKEISDIPVILWSAYHYSDIKDKITSYKNVYYVSKRNSCFNELSKLIRSVKK